MELQDCQDFQYFQYYCQTEIQSILDHIVPVPDDFEVPDCYLCGLDSREFVRCFKKLREMMLDVYRDMQKDPEAYGLICTSLTIAGFGVSEITGKSRESASWLMMLLYSLGTAGTLSENTLRIAPEKYFEMEKTKWVGGNKVRSAPQIISKLSQSGFAFHGLKEDGKFDKKAEAYELSFPRDQNIIKALKGYIMSVPLERHFSGQLVHLDYKLLTDPAKIPPNQHILDFESYLDSENEKVFFAKMHDALVKNGYFHAQSYGYRVRYSIKENDKNYTVECQSYGRKLTVGIKLKNMDRYSDFIHSLPEHIKRMFCESSCNSPRCTFQGATPENCRFRITWHVDGIEYRKCSFEQVFSPPVYRPDDVGYYIQLLLLDKKQK